MVTSPVAIRATNRPGEIEIEPRALQDTNAEFFVDQHGDEPSHEEVAQRVDHHGAGGEPWMIQKIKAGRVYWSAAHVLPGHCANLPEEPSLGIQGRPLVLRRARRPSKTTRG